jgi:hypothetical protein
MQANDMSHMAEIFTTPLLPYKEFLVTHGEHQAQLMQGGKLGKHYHARYEFPCGTEVSVISGPLFYCNLDAPYEYRIGAEEPVGYQTDEELYVLLTKVIAGAVQRGDDYMGGDAEHRLQDDAMHRAVDNVHRTYMGKDEMDVFAEGLKKQAITHAHPKP